MQQTDQKVIDKVLDNENTQNELSMNNMMLSDKNSYPQNMFTKEREYDPLELEKPN